MASSALHGCMCISQRKVSQCMIEGCRVEFDDVGVPSLVLGMAGAAFSLGCMRHAAMHAATILQIGGNILMACRAQRVLP